MMAETEWGSESSLVQLIHPSWSRRATHPPYHHCTVSLPALDQLPTCDHGVVGDAGPADAVVSGARHLSGTAGAVAVEPVVGVARVGVGVVAAEVVACPGILEWPGSFLLCWRVLRFSLRNY